MKLLPALLCFLLLLTCARGAEWPALFQEFEEAAVRAPAGEAVPPLLAYALHATRLAELRARWTAAAAQPDGWRYSLLLARLAMLRGEDAEARALLRTVTGSRPAEAAGWLLLGEYESGQKTDAARAALEQAVALGQTGGDAGRAVLLLARDHLRHERPAEALAAMEQGWAAAREPADLHALLAEWIPLAATHGRLSELFTRLEEAKPRGNDTNPALTLAYVQVGDFPMALATLEKARRSNPKDALLRECCIPVCRIGRYATTEDDLLELKRVGDPAPRALAQLVPLAEADPSPAALAALLNAWLSSGAVDQARALLAQHGPELAQTAARWRSSVGYLWQHGLAAEADAVLATRPDAWENTFCRAELRIAEDKYDEAAEFLWKLLTRPPGEEPLSSVLRPLGGPAPGLPDRDLIGGSDFARRRLGLRDRLVRPEILSLFESRSRLYPDLLFTFAAARDHALFYLWYMAGDTKSEPAFFTRLAATIAPWPARERLYAWSLFDRPEQELAAIEAWAGEAGISPPTDQYCRQELKNMGSKLRTDPALQARSTAVLARLDDPARVPEGERVAVPKAERPQWPRNPAGFFKAATAQFAAGKFSEALASCREAAQGQHNLNAELRPSGALHTMVLKLPSFAGDPAQFAEGASTLLQCLAALPHDASTPEYLPSGKALWYPSLAMSYTIPGRDETALREVQARAVYPPAALLTTEATAVLWGLFSVTLGKPEVWSSLDALPGKLPPDRPPAERLRLRTAICYLQWWIDQKAEAETGLWRLLEETGDDNVRLALGAILHRYRRFAEAGELLNGMKLPYPGFRRIVESWQLRLAGEGQDKATVTKLAGRLLHAPLSSREILALAQAVQFVSREDALAFMARLAEESAAREKLLPGQLGQMDYLYLQDPPAIVAKAKQTLAQPITSRRFAYSNGGRPDAIRILQQMGKLDEYVAEQEKLSLAQPDSIDAQVRFAEATQDAEKSAAAYRRALQLEPGNRMASCALLDRRDPIPAAEQIPIFEGLLARAPELTLEQFGVTIAKLYEQEKQLPRLAAAVVKAPFHRAAGGQDLAKNLAILAQRMTAAGEPAAAALVTAKAGDLALSSR